MNKIIGIKAISFDADGTLWDFEKVMRRSLHHVLTELKKLDPSAADMLDIEKMIKIRNRVANELKGRITNLEDIRLEAFQQTLEYIGKPRIPPFKGARGISIDALASHLNQVYLKHRFEDIELFDDVRPTLKALRVKYALGILSNGNSYPERCGLEDIFQFVVFSQDYGVEKPNSRLFQIAVEKAECSKRQLLHVGDSLENDIMGAINAGIKCVWINRKRVKHNLNLKIDYEVSSLLELLELLK